MIFNYWDSCYIQIHNHILRYYLIGELNGYNVRVISIMGLTALVSFLLGFRIFRIPPNYRTFNPDGYLEQYWRGFKGFLLFLMILILFEPFRSMNLIRQSSFLASNRIIDILCDPESNLYNNWWRVTVYGIHITNTIRLVLSGFLVASLITRRRNFRIILTV